ELIAKGLNALPHSAVVSMIVAAIAAVAIEAAKIATKGRFPLSAVAIGLGVVLPPEATFAMWIGAVLFWWQSRRHRAAVGTRGHDIWVGGYESICAGLISGAALMGIGNALLNVLL
ncbi:MAG TPA: OPT/YSL family transporter, partial [Usitatibacter sp.]|nr:OPT/YSL family transporter [Usitatibacter sp.]